MNSVSVYNAKQHRDVLGGSMYAIGHELADDINLRDTHSPVDPRRRKPHKKRLRRYERSLATELATRRAVQAQGDCYPSDS
jgi:hypothetical protein